MELEVNEFDGHINTLLEIYGSGDSTSTADALRSLRNLCPHGNNYQQAIAQNQKLNELLQKIIFETPVPDPTVHMIALQVMANCIVCNPITQQLVWQQHGVKIVEHTRKPPLNRNNDILLMIMYNIHKGDTGVVTDQNAFETCVRLWQKVIEEKSNYQFDYLHFFFEHFLVNNGRKAVRCYSKLNVEERIACLDYLETYIRSINPNGLVHKFLLQHISKEFKIKSDCVLRHSEKQSNQLHPREVQMLLRVIANASGSKGYAPIYATDHSLFLNVSSLLRSLVELGKTPDGGGLPKPMAKLEEVATTSKTPSDYQSDASFELKTLLVRCTANLLYKNRMNKQYTLDTQLIPALLECTQLDARNPLMREWSILAIRNACIGCPEIQKVIENLNMQGMAKNDLLSELNLELGALRISANKS